MHDGILAVRVQNTTIKFAFAILRCRWVERHFERAGQFVRDHTAIACHYMSHFAEAAAATSRICNSINIVRVRSGLTVFIFGSNWNGCQWHMVTRPPMCKYIYLLHLRYSQNYLRHLIVWAVYLNIENTCHWRFFLYTYLLFSTTNTNFCIFWNSNAKHLQCLANNVDIINNLLWL